MAALVKEISLQKNYLGSDTVETIYFGGGTPSLLEAAETGRLLDEIRENFSLTQPAEITLEANPDDITEEKLQAWKRAGINRLSIGIQSFFEEDLKWMNRAHSATQARNSLLMAIPHFDNITLDLIYGYPLLTHDKWKYNVEQAIALTIPHLSCYALTVEPKTPLAKMIRQKQKEAVLPEHQAEQFVLLMRWLRQAGYEQYEISNFARPGFRSRHNSSYWKGEKYLGLGPSAHSYDGRSRQWNAANNSVYISSLRKDEIPFEKEILTASQQLNEYIMTSLRTAEGLDLEKIHTQAPIIRNRSQKYIAEGKMVVKENKLILTPEGKLFADGIAADLFVD